LLTLSSSAQNAVYYHYSIKEGLPSNKIYSLRQDNQGYLWIGTDKGMARFNGKTFRVFTVEDGLPTNDVFYCYIDPEDRVWLYDYTPYVTYIKNDTVHSFRIFPENVPFNKSYYGYYKGFVFANKGNQYLVAAGSMSASRIDIEKRLRKLLPGVERQRPSNTDRLQCSGNELVIYNNNGTAYYNFVTGAKRFIRFHPQTDSFPYRANRQSPLLVQHKLVGFLRDSAGIAMSLDLQRGTFRKLDVSKYFPDFSSVRVFDFLPPGIQISTNTGLLTTDTAMNIVDAFSLPSNLKYISLNMMYKDISGNFWLSTFNDGLYVISREMKKFKQMNLQLNNDGRKLTSVYFSDGRYYIFDETDRLFVTDKNFNLERSFQLQTNIAFQTDPRPIQIFEDKGRGHYIVSSKGIYFLDKQLNLFSIFDFRGDLDEGFLTHAVHAFKSSYFDTGSHKLIFLNHAEVYQIWFDGVFHQQLIMKKRFTNICYDNNGRYWLSDDLGNLIIANTQLKMLQTFNVKTPVTRLFSDPHHNVIFSLDGKGVFVYDAKDFKLDKVYGGNELQHLHLDSSGLWLATNSYIKHFRFQDDQYRLSHTFLNTRGLLYQNIYAIAPQYDSVLILCDKGVLTTRIAPDGVPNLQFTRSPFISALTCGTERYVLDKAVTRFAHDYRNANIDFEFTSNSTSYLGDVSYRYFLEGNDNDWQYSTEESFSYPALQPGTYRLHLRAMVNNAPVESDEYVLTIEILPLWWQTIWFRLLAVMGGISLVVYVVYARVKNIRLAAQKNTAMNKRVAELELSALQAQMNPHFIFNALSSVQSYIKINDRQVAEQLVQKFSMLIRLYFEFSRHKRITLSQEIKALRLYTEIEQLRFNNKFDVIITCRSPIPAETVRIPPMMIQPLVENAINHGLYHKSSKGRLKILFWVKGDQLVIVIDDDGIGRDAAKKLRSKIFPSRGNAIIKERIEVLRASGLADASMIIRDKFKKDNTPSGTRVILNMNLENL